MARRSIQGGRNSPARPAFACEYADKNSRNLHPPLNITKGWSKSGRCYFCYDAPCMQDAHLDRQSAVHRREGGRFREPAKPRSLGPRPFSTRIIRRHVRPASARPEKLCEEGLRWREAIAEGKSQGWQIRPAAAATPPTFSDGRAEGTQFYKGRPRSKRQEEIAVVGAGTEAPLQRAQTGWGAPMGHGSR